MTRRRPQGIDYFYTATVSSSASAHITDFATMRAPAPGSLCDRFLPYAFAGAALGRGRYLPQRDRERITRHDIPDSVTPPATPITPQPDRLYLRPAKPEAENRKGVFAYGYTAGWASTSPLLPNVFLRAEWEYVQFFRCRISKSISIPAASASASSSSGVRIGFIFRSGAPRMRTRVILPAMSRLTRGAAVPYFGRRATPPQRGASIWKDRAMSNPPGVRPVIPHFSSGPCAKRPGWSLQALTDAVLGRSHRSKIGKAKLKRAIDLTREVLEVPADYRIGIVPASDTGAVEMALWSLLGPAARHHAGLGIVRRRLGQRRPEGAQAQGRHGAQGAVRRAARPFQGRSGVRRGVHLERHDLGRARAQRRLDQGRPRRA